MKRWENRSGLLSECEQMDNMENMSGTSGYKRLKMILERRKQGCFKHVEWISSNLKMKDFQFSCSSECGLLEKAAIFHFTYDR